MEAGTCCANTLLLTPVSPRAHRRPVSRPLPSCGSVRLQGILKYGHLKRSTTPTVASASHSDSCDSRFISTPLEPKSFAGKFLSSVLKNQRHLFNFAAVEQLEQLAFERDEAMARQMNSGGSGGSMESFLHGRIAEIKGQECQIAIEEVMYMMIVHKFSEIEVPMVPRLSNFISDGKIEILTSKDQELESVHSLEIVEMVRDHLYTILSRQHLSTVLGCNGKIDISENWATTRIRRLNLGRLYAASVMYGYFLKSASLRHHLELNLALAHHDASLAHGFQFPAIEGCIKRSEESLAVLDRPGMRSLYQAARDGLNAEKLRSFIMEFDSETLQRCAKLKSGEAVNLIERHTWALFGDDDKEQLDHRDVVSLTFSSLKRLVLEAVAFGSFLWDVERYVDTFYRLDEN